MNIEDYTEKSFVIFGTETKNHKETLKELGGKYNSNLKVGPGWIFSKNNKESVEKWFNSIHNLKQMSINNVINDFSSYLCQMGKSF